MCLADGGGRSRVRLFGKGKGLGHMSPCAHGSPFPFAAVAGNGASLKSHHFLLPSFSRSWASRCNCLSPFGADPVALPVPSAASLLRAGEQCQGNHASPSPPSPTWMCQQPLPSRGLAPVLLLLASELSLSQPSSFQPQPVEHFLSAKTSARDPRQRHRQVARIRAFLYQLAPGLERFVSICV